MTAESTLFRSEPMSLCQLVLQPEAAYPCVADLGQLGLVQFKDLNSGKSAFNRKHVNEVKRCDEMERKIMFFEKLIVNDAIPIDEVFSEPKAPRPQEMIDLEASLDKMEVELKEVNNNSEALKKNFTELTEMKQILIKTQHFFSEREAGVFDDNLAIIGQDVLANQQSTVQLSFISGVIKRDRMNAFERMMWRVCRNNVLLRFDEIEQPLIDVTTGHEVKKCVFILFFQGDQLKTRVKKICEGFRATLYPCPDTAAERNEMAVGVSTRISDLNTVLAKTEDHRKRLLISAASHLKLWFIRVRKMKAIYHILNQFNFDTIHKCMLAQLWCPTMSLPKVRTVLQDTAMKSSSVQPILDIIQTDEIRPTYVRTNKFTRGFQNLVDSYGVADYREMNPGPFAIISFPFLFAVMFGDAGHGVIMAVFALWMCLYERRLGAKRTNNEMWNIIFAGRYIILLMGLFSIYTGFIYNDIFSKSMNIFGSSWGSKYSDKLLLDNKLLQMDPAPYQNLTRTGGNYYMTPYIFGIDPVWQLSQNKLTFLNSYKMKLSVILGVLQMLFGVFLSLFNHIYFRRYLNIFLEFIPQVIFLMMLFGYLCVLIFWKWFKFDASTSSSAPSLLITLIDMFMQKEYPFYMYDKDVQTSLQIVLVIVAVICIPWMLFIKPFVLLCRNNRKMKQRERLDNGLSFEELHPAPVPNHSNGRDAPKTSESGGGHGDGEFEFGEVFIHQAIHTIDYCLGCISNTASYLRLWALSLAHSQLSDVLWTMVFRNALNFVPGNVGGITLALLFAPWAILTVVILLIMEGLSAFLHALRLHWVEFQNKFYTGSGYLFTPFSFKAILNEIDGIDS